MPSGAPSRMKGANKREWIELYVSHLFAMPSGPYSILYADPPWRYRPQGSEPRPPRAPYRVKQITHPPYPCVSTHDLRAMPIAPLRAKDCTLFLWAIYPMLPDAIRVMAAWGFQYWTRAFTWVKQNPSGEGFHLGTGYWTRANPEVCLLGVRGRPMRQQADVRNLIVSPRREYSRKPDEARDRIIALAGDLPRLELFARQKSEGWAAWGNEIESDIVIDWQASTQSLQRSSVEEK